MEELLKKILESDLLTEETRSQFQVELKKVIEEATKEARQKAEIETRQALTEQFIDYRDTLVEALDVKLNDALEKEIKELKEDIDRFRDLEKEKAEQIVEIEQKMAEELKENLNQLTDRLDSYLQVVLAKEVKELKEDIEEAKKNEFGRKIMEAFASEYENHLFKIDEHSESVYELQQKLSEMENALERSERKIDSFERKSVMENVLSPLSGRARDVMEAILKSYKTDMLQEAYDTFISKVLKETVEIKPEKILTESDGKTINGVIKTGDKSESLVESKKEVSPEIKEMLILAGLQTK